MGEIPADSRRLPLPRFLELYVGPYYLVHPFDDLLLREGLLCPSPSGVKIGKELLEEFDAQEVVWRLREGAVRRYFIESVGGLHPETAEILLFPLDSKEQGREQ